MGWAMMPLPTPAPAKPKAGRASQEAWLRLEKPRPLDRLEREIEGYTNPSTSRRAPQRVAAENC